MWFGVLLPQLLHNYLRRSTSGLSVLWASANATASLCNLFFVLSRRLPYFTETMAIYMPAIEILLVIQFAQYNTERWWRKAQFAITMGVIWLAVILTGALAGKIGRSTLQWLAVVLWSVESFPQLFHNVEKSQTRGQSKLSVAFACVGKFSDFLSFTLLQMPIQMRVLCYMSTALAWINAAEVIVLEGLHRFTSGVLICSVLLFLEVILIAATVWRIGFTAMIMPLTIFVVLTYHWVYVSRHMATSIQLIPEYEPSSSNQRGETPNTASGDSDDQYKEPLCAAKQDKTTAFDTDFKATS
jgi:hypothetical protein